MICDDIFVRGACLGRVQERMYTIIQQQRKRDGVGTVKEIYVQGSERKNSNKYGVRERERVRVEDEVELAIW